jgi:hypothetical protein
VGFESKGLATRSQRKSGIGYSAGKSDTPPGGIAVADFRIVANSREKIPMIRACVAGGGWRGGFRWALVLREIRFHCGNNFSDDGGGVHRH